jgi:hypothetical protein
MKDREKGRIPINKKGNKKKAGAGKRREKETAIRLETLTI